jgi:hypothetical protein
MQVGPPIFHLFPLLPEGFSIEKKKALSINHEYNMKGQLERLARKNSIF